MQTRLFISKQVFRLGMVVMMLSAVASVCWNLGIPWLLPLVAAAGATLALASRIWHRKLLRRFVQGQHLFELGGYPGYMLGESFFRTSDRRVA